jgi:hypothetical protein
MSKPAGLKQCLVIFLPVAVGVYCWLHFVGPEKPATGRTPSNLARMAGPSDVNPSVFNLAAIAQTLQKSTDTKVSRQSLTQLRDYLQTLSPEAAVALIRQWLDTGTDALTLEGFKISPDGSLKEAPSLRVWLLDYLTSIDPRAAADYTETIFRSSTSPDEWAVGLRASALADSSPEGRARVQEKVRALVQTREWHNNPSAGFLEAFDLLVYTRDQEFTPELASLLKDKKNKAVAHAAYLTLDRLVQAAPVEVLEQLQSQPKLMEGRETTRADFFARVDVRDPQQRKIVETYLLDPKRGITELNQFAGTYPNANYMISFNLMTRTAAVSGDELAARDREALKVAQEWLADPKFSALSSHLQAIKSRLEQFVKPSPGN